MPCYFTGAVISCRPNKTAFSIILLVLESCCVKKKVWWSSTWGIQESKKKGTWKGIVWNRHYLTSVQWNQTLTLMANYHNLLGKVKLSHVSFFVLWKFSQVDLRLWFQGKHFSSSQQQPYKCKLLRSFITEIIQHPQKLSRCVIYVRS